MFPCIFDVVQLFWQSYKAAVKLNPSHFSSLQNIGVIYHLKVSSSCFSSSFLEFTVDQIKLLVVQHFSKVFHPWKESLVDSSLRILGIKGS